MSRYMIAIACIAAVLIPVASLADPGVKHALCGGSGLAVSHSAGMDLTSFLGRCGGVFVLQRSPYPGQGSDPGAFAKTSSELVPAVRTGLDQSYPNPFNPSTTIRYSVEAASRVTLKIYDVSGQLVRTLIEGDVSAGEHAVPWDGVNARGARATSGIYFVRLGTEWGVFSRKMILAR